jgi:putative acetyltransferase
MLTIRTYHPEDADTLLALFLDTVRHVNSKDYSPSQIAVWASDEIDVNNWRALLNHHQPFVAVLDELIVGYADLQADGLIDHFYCHALYQGKGIGTALMHRIMDEARLLALDSVHANVSITAKPFFTSFGFDVVAEQSVERRGEFFTNYLMRRTV